MDQLLRRICIEQFHPEKQFTYETCRLLYTSLWLVCSFSSSGRSTSEENRNEKKVQNGRVPIVLFETPPLTNSTFVSFWYRHPVTCWTFPLSVPFTRNVLITQHPDHRRRLRHHNFPWVPRRFYPDMYSSKFPERKKGKEVHVVMIIQARIIIERRLKSNRCN